MSVHVGALDAHIMGLHITDEKVWTMVCPYGHILSRVMFYYELGG